MSWLLDCSNIASILDINKFMHKGGKRGFIGAKTLIAAIIQHDNCGCNQAINVAS